jgi:hypothetical protein
MSAQNVAPFRNSLIKKGMIYSPAHGDTVFTVPLFADLIKEFGHTILQGLQCYAHGANILNRFHGIIAARNFRSGGAN